MRQTFTILFTLAAVVAAAGVTSNFLVFTDGTRIDDVQAEVNGAMVWVKTANGAMQAYPLEEVDIAASGLTAKPVPKPPPEVEGDEPEFSGGSRLTAARAKTSGTSRLLITDADVEHVQPEELLTDEEDDEGSGGQLVVENLSHTPVGNKINVTGMVVNITDEAQSNIAVVVTAYNEEDQPIASGETVLPRALGPNARTPFSTLLVGTGEVAKVEARASSTPAQPRREAPPPERPQPGDRAPGEQSEPD